MRVFKSEMWSYAVLLIILFVIATIAVGSTLSYIEEIIEDHEKYQIIATMVFSLTLGFMFIAGSFGLWAIKFSSEAEARRRVGRLVDAMDYLSDGLIVVDFNGKITGSNPAARHMSASTTPDEPLLKEAFPCLSQEDVDLMLESDCPCEVERSDMFSVGGAVFRFRSQPVEDVALVFISDITALNLQKTRSRQVARLQLVGDIARGVAHDFNNLLCGISGYISVLPRLQPGSAEMKESIRSVTLNVERGVALAGHLLHLAEPPVSGRSTDLACEHIESATQVLRDSLPEGWKVEFTRMDAIPAVFVTGSQIEQVVVNLGYLIADAVKDPSVLRIFATPPLNKGLFNVGKEYAGVIVISALASVVDNEIKERKGEVGVILSVIASMLEGAGGGLDCFYSADGSPVFRVRLLHGSVPVLSPSDFVVPEEIKVYVSGWKVVMAVSEGKENRNLVEALQGWGLHITLQHDIVSLLASIEEAKELDVCVIDARLLGREINSLLKAVLKLRPGSGFVVLCVDPDELPRELCSDLVLESISVPPGSLVTSMIEARSLAMKRRG